MVNVLVSFFLRTAACVNIYIATTTCVVFLQNCYVNICKLTKKVLYLSKSYIFFSDNVTSTGDEFFSFSLFIILSFLFIITVTFFLFFFNFIRVFRYKPKILLFSLAFFWPNSLFCLGFFFLQKFRNTLGDNLWKCLFIGGINLYSS